MSSYGSWSVKGIDDRARAAAKDAAREKGLTLGDYINTLLLDGHSEAGPRDRDERFDPFAARQPRADNTPIDSLARRIEAVEARSTLAITGIDQSVLGLLARLDNTESTSAAIAADVERMIDEVRETQEALQAKVQEIDSDDTGRQNLEAMKALEQALGKLAAHVHEENSLQGDEAQAIKGRVELGFADLGERVETMEVKVEATLSETAKRVEKAVEQAELRAEGASRHLSERFSAIESEVATKLSKVDEMDTRMHHVEDDVSGAIQSMESTLVRVQERLNRAESTTDAALSGLEQTFESLDKRLETVASHANPEQAEALRKQFEDQFEGLAASLRASVEQTRTQLANEIERAAAGANPELMGRLETTVDELKARLETSEQSSNTALTDLSDQVTQLSEDVDTRFAAIIERDDQVIDQVGAQMTDLAERLDERVLESEERSAEAIQQIGEQVTGAVGRLQAKQEHQFEAFGARLEAASKRQDARLSKALSNVSERLTEMQNKTASVVSPVQKAIASLATRLEDIENFNTPPGISSQSTPLPEMPKMQAESSTPIDLPPEPAPLPAEPNLADEPQEEEFEFVAGIPEAAPHLDEPHDPYTEITAETVPSAVSDQAFPEQGDESVFETGFDEWSVIEPASAQHAAEDFQTSDEPLPYQAESQAHLDALADWDDGRDETRESDIFSSDSDPLAEVAEINDTFGSTVFMKETEETDEADQPTTAEHPDLSEDALNAEADADAAESNDADPSLAAEDYISRARQAAIAAAETRTEQPLRRATRVPPPPKTAATASTRKPTSKLPVFMAASVLAISAAGAGAYISLRGKQPSAGSDVAQSKLPEAAPKQVANMDGAAEASLEGVSFQQTAADIDADLFEEEQGSAEPRGETLSINSLTNPPAVSQAVALPTIPEPMDLGKAALLGDPVAELAFGEQRIKANDFIKGAEFIGYAAKQGQPTAQYRYAKLFEKGLGVPRDLAEARAWTERAAKGGNIKAMHDLAVFYADGESGEQSYAAAARWFASAADHGLVDSQYNLAVLYENGLGISPSLTEALYWSEIAAANGDPAAAQRVSELRAKLTLDEAQTVQRRAANWTATRALPAANGEFQAHAWDSGNNAQVKAAQEVLNGLGYDAGKADGVIGPATKTALSTFQTDHGLDVTGELSGAVIEKLNEVVRLQS